MRNELTLDTFQLREQAREKSDEAMFRFRMLSELEKKEINLQEIKKLIERFENKEPIRKDVISNETIDIPIDDLIVIASKVFGIRPTLLRKKGSKHPVVKCRWFIYKTLYERKWTYQEICDEFSMADHAAVLRGRNSLNKLIEKKDPIYYPLWVEYLRGINNYKPL
jgi:chromosomal replication initiation ATPase DnaA